MKETEMLRLVVFLAALTTGVAHAERSPNEGQKLAKAAVQQLQQLEPLVLEGQGLSGAPAATYYRTFLNPLQQSVDTWPTLGDKEFNTWGDYMYCRDALLALQVIGMGQNNSTLKGDNAKRKVTDYQRIKGKCQTASRLSPDQVQ